MENDNVEYNGFKYLIKTYYHSHPEQLYAIIDAIKGSDLDVKDKATLIAYATSFIDKPDTEKTLDEAKEVNLDEIDPFDLVMDTIACTGRQVTQISPKTGKASPRIYGGLYDCGEVGTTKDDNIIIVIPDEERIDKGVEFAKKYDMNYKKSYREDEGKWALILDPWTVDVEKLYPDRNQFATAGLYKQDERHKKKARTEVLEEESVDIDVENEGILEVPKGRNVNELPLSHFEKLVDKKGYAPIIRALNNLQVWNRKTNRSLSNWAGRVMKKLKDRHIEEKYLLEDIATNKYTKGIVFNSPSIYTNEEFIGFDDNEGIAKLGESSCMGTDYNTYIVWWHSPSYHSSVASKYRDAENVESFSFNKINNRLDDYDLNRLTNKYKWQLKNAAKEYINERTYPIREGVAETKDRIYTVEANGNVYYVLGYDYSDVKETLKRGLGDDVKLSPLNPIKFESVVNFLRNMDTSKKYNLILDEDIDKEDSSKRGKYDNSYVIYKNNGKIYGTPSYNYYANIQNAHLINNYHDFDSVEEVSDYLKNTFPNLKVKIIDQRVTEDTESASEEVINSTPENYDNNSLTTMLNDLIKEEYDTIDAYNATILAAKDLGREDIVEVLTTIAHDENTHVGNLLVATKLVNPQTQAIDKGEQQALDTLEGNVEIKE